MFVYLFKIIYDTGWEKCAVRPRLEPGTPHLQGDCSANWAIHKILKFNVSEDAKNQITEINH